jgi:hypothetical protein
MEAHQKFDAPIDLTGWRQIRLVLTDADPYAGLISLELILIDREAAGARAASLGKMAVRSHPGQEQALNYELSAAAGLTQLDEIRIVFHPDAVRRDKSARIAIQRFVLVP